MRDYRVFDTASQNEALINEFKGNLFEYLVGAQLARHINCEADFMRSLDKELASRLRSYEDWLWQNDQVLAQQLPILAKQAGEELLGHLGQEFSKVLVVGKLAGGSHDESFGEADLLLLDKHEKVFPISLKLCRKGAYVNTKSAGVRSFLSKYFSPIHRMALAQEELNLILDHSFAEFSQVLHKRHGLDEEDSFGNAWKEADLPLLPGSLEIADQELLQEHYFRIISLIYDSLADAFKNERQQFDLAMASLLGLKAETLIQMTCFHHQDKQQRYQIDHIDIVHQQERLKQLGQAKLSPPIKGQASFSIQYPWGVFQVRVKPMNKFTQAALKVNCSVRHS